MAAPISVAPNQSILTRLRMRDSGTMVATSTPPTSCIVRGRINTLTIAIAERAAPLNGHPRQPSRPHSIRPQPLRSASIIP